MSVTCLFLFFYYLVDIFLFQELN